MQIFIQAEHQDENSIYKTQKIFLPNILNHAPNQAACPRTEKTIQLIADFKPLLFSRKHLKNLTDKAFFRIKKLNTGFKKRFARIKYLLTLIFYNIFYR